ncbi:FHA domain-containing protein [Phormidium tenue]|uniref:FHA domain-containing protein n=1 Tax=Phormidium tenue FACHB-1050 TaxID=2692857 RepID=A0ABR8CC12_9CYAN|nr:FHA domain-containing protein [Phormidium tenue]MBD2317177.1 FHA domain-containing protein [Phormidium tenue FACHB-1050]
MIICPSCAHANPDGAVNCESCFTPLPIVKNIQCPSCGASVLSDAKFCGHCGFNLSGATAINSLPDIHAENAIAPSISSTEVFPVLTISSAMSNSLPDVTTEDDSAANLVTNSFAEVPTLPKFTDIENLLAAEEQNPPITASMNEPISAPTSAPASSPVSVKTQLQQFAASLLHVQTNLTIEIPAHLPVVHIGKPNTVIPPDIDVSGFPDSDIVSRIHADIRAEGGSFYFEDTGSSNGTYINNLPLPAGNRHKLRAGDRISLGKGDKVSFVFQLSS